MVLPEGMTDKGRARSEGPDSGVLV